MKALYCLLAVLACVPLLHAEEPYWVEPMRQVHAEYSGDGGTIARFGDSITVSLAFFSPLQWSHTNTTPEDDAALSWIQSYMTGSCWGWQNDSVAYDHGCWGGTTSNWPMQYELDPSKRNIDYWLDKWTPEMAVIMWGTNDLTSGPALPGYTDNMREVVQACKAHGTIPIITTIPPRHGHAANAADYAAAVRQIALDEQIPLIDYHDEIVTRRPHDPPNDTWDGADPMWSGYSGYEVPTLISRDGVHPSNWSAGRSNFDQVEGLDKNGFTLRNWMTLHACHEVFNEVIDAPPWVPFEIAVTNYAYLGGGKYSYEVAIDGRDGYLASYFANVTFEGINGATIQQIQGTYPGEDPEDVDSEYRATVLDLLDPNYDKQLDSYFADEFAYEGNVLEISQGPNTYHMEAGTAGGDLVEDVDLAYIVADGDIRCSGTISRRAKNYPFTLDLPAPPPGDATLDGQVDGADYTLWADNYLSEDLGWVGGDFNGDGVTDGADYTIWADNYGVGGMSVPEPASLVLLGLSSVALLRRRR